MLRAKAFFAAAVLAAVASVAAAEGGPLFSPDGGCADTLLAAIAAAQETIDVEMYFFTDAALADALITAHDRGVAVRVLLDGGQFDLAASQGKRLAAAGISVRYEKSRGLLHAKLAIFDKKVAAVGSYNWTRRAEVDNVEILMLVEDPEYIKAFREHFAAAWATAGRDYTPPRTNGTPKGAYVASRNSNRFHFPTCPYVRKIKDDSQVWYEDREAALADGKQPCYYCGP